MLSGSVRDARARERELHILRSKLESADRALAPLAERVAILQNALDEEKLRNRVYRDEMEASLVLARERESRLEARCDALQARCEELETAGEQLRVASERVRKYASAPQPRTPSAESPSLAARQMPSAAPLSPAVAYAVALASEARRARLAGILCSPAYAGHGGGDSDGCAGARDAVTIACSSHAADHAADHRLGEQQSLCRLVYFAHRELHLSLEGGLFLRTRMCLLCPERHVPYASNRSVVCLAPTTARRPSSIGNLLPA